MAYRHQLSRWLALLHQSQLQATHHSISTRIRITAVLTIIKTQQRRDHHYSSTNLISKFQRNVKKRQWILEDDVSTTQANYLNTTLASLAPGNVFNANRLANCNNDTTADNPSRLNAKNGIANDKVLLLSGQNVPLGYHFIYFNPMNDELLLGSDGYDNHQAPTTTGSDSNENSNGIDKAKKESELFDRRLWVGGKLLFNNDNKLRLSEPASCIEIVDKVRAITRADNTTNKDKHNDINDSNNNSNGIKIKNVTTKDNIFVSIDRKVFNGTDLSIRESRTLLYTNEPFSLAKLQQSATFAQENPKYSKWDHNISVKVSQLLAFRYSALTFNAHRIHYDPQYAKMVEQYPGTLVQGPLTVTLLLQWFESLLVGEEEQKWVLGFSYKNKYPLFVGDEMKLKCGRRGNQEEGEILEYNVWIENGDGVVCVEGVISTELEF